MKQLRARTVSLADIHYAPRRLFNPSAAYVPVRGLPCGRHTGGCRLCSSGPLPSAALPCCPPPYCSPPPPLPTPSCSPPRAFPSLSRASTLLSLSSLSVLAGYSALPRTATSNGPGRRVRPLLPSPSPRLRLLSISTPVGLQEEFERLDGYWWSPDSCMIAFQEVVEEAVPPFRIQHHGSPVFQEEEHRY